MRSRVFLFWVVAAVAVTCAGAAWELTALHIFAKRAGEMKGMIANPRPLDYVNYDYTPNGHHYELWAFKVPTLGTGVLLLAVGVAASVIFGRAGLRQTFGLWAVIVFCAAAFFAITAYHYVIAVNVFV